MTTERLDYNLRFVNRWFLVRYTCGVVIVMPVTFMVVYMIWKIKLFYITLFFGARGGAVGWGTALQDGRSRVWFPIMSMEIFLWHNPSGCTMEMGTTQPLTEMITRNISWWGKGGRCVGRTTLEPSSADCFEIWEPHPPGTIRVSPGLYRNCLPLQSLFFVLVKRAAVDCPL